MEDVKNWWQSKGIWGGIIALVSLIAGFFGFALGPEDQAALVGVAVTVSGLIGTVLGIVGRVTAKKAIGKPS